MPLASDACKAGAANCAGPWQLLEVWFTTCCLHAAVACWSRGGTDGTEFVSGVVLETLLFAGGCVRHIRLLMDVLSFPYCVKMRGIEDWAKPWPAWGLLRHHVAVETSVGLGKEKRRCS